MRCGPVRSTTGRMCMLNAASMTRPSVSARRFLPMKETSPDCRFIALLRRSRSYDAVGNHQAALDDLGGILETWDITPHQKADALLDRAVIMRHLERWAEAQADLEAIIASSYLFSGSRGMALVELA